MEKNIMVAGAVFAGIAVILGAMAAHTLENILDPRNLQSFETAVQYQFYHALSLLIIAALQHKYKSRFFSYSASFFVAGIVLFCGSIYLLSARELFNMPGLRILGPVTPFGGISFIIGWIFLTIAGFEIKNGEKRKTKV